MFNFSGVLYRIWGVCGEILVLGVACILLNRPWARKVKIKDCKLGLIMIAAAIGLSLLYASRIVFPGVSSYTGEFIDSHRNSRVAPPLPITNEYVFWNGEGKNKLYPLRKERVCKGGRCLLGTSSAFFVGEFYVRRIIL